MFLQIYTTFCLGVYYLDREFINLAWAATALIIRVRKAFSIDAVPPIIIATITHRTHAGIFTWMGAVCCITWPRATGDAASLRNKIINMLVRKYSKSKYLKSSLFCLFIRDFGAYVLIYLPYSGIAHIHFAVKWMSHHQCNYDLENGILTTGRTKRIIMGQILTSNSK